MENSTIENQVITLDQVEVRNLPELQGWKEKQQQLVKENPFVAIEDYKSYEDAKKHRTALVSARTTIQNQDKLIAKKLKELRTEAGKVAEELIAITQPHEEKQQDEVKRYEAEKEAERLEKERQDQERKEAIQKSVNEFYKDWKKDISLVDFAHLEKLETALNGSIEKQKEKDFEEFELDFAEKCNLLKDQLKERSQYLTEKEEARKEKERLAAERAAWEKEQAEAREKAANEEAERKPVKKKNVPSVKPKKRRSVKNGKPKPPNFAKSVKNWKPKRNALPMPKPKNRLQLKLKKKPKRKLKPKLKLKPKRKPGKKPKLKDWRN